MMIDFHFKIFDVLKGFFLNSCCSEVNVCLRKFGSEVVIVSMLKKIWKHSNAKYLRSLS
jgi:hypothetical protein